MCATSLLAIIVQYCQFDCVIYTTEEKPCCICQYSVHLDLCQRPGATCAVLRG
ncbi:hypothetical protein PF003_g17441 [Phytophthora fragariae]|nr:hypothetical protein PF003_g17441 [Phytophthora fragariae]